MSKDEIINKWSSLFNSGGLTSSKADWLSDYAQGRLKTESNSTTQQFPSLLPVAMRVAAKTIGQDLVTVQPMAPPGMSQADVDRITNEVKKENRHAKIDSLIQGKDFKEMKPEEHPDWKPGRISLMYLDFKYGHKKTRRAGKKHKKK
jgi:hypothetical protein